MVSVSTSPSQRHSIRIFKQPPAPMARCSSTCFFRCNDVHNLGCCCEKRLKSRRSAGRSCPWFSAAWFKAPARRCIDPAWWVSVAGTDCTKNTGGAPGNLPDAAITGFYGNHAVRPPPFFSSIFRCSLCGGKSCWGGVAGGNGGV